MTINNEKPKDFIRAIIAADLADSTKPDELVSRFPPEPNGYLHIGHAKSICLNFGVAAENQGCCHLRFDDTNPAKEEKKYIGAIIADIRWLGFDWGENLFYASDYFEQFYEYAVKLVKMGLAYVCDLSADEMRQYRGTLTEPGQNSPYRNRTITENLFLLAGMRRGDFPEGSHILRAKIDMASPNLNMRDPAIYRIRKITHHRTGNEWNIYPIYDFAHCLSDAIEGITHSLCTLEFQDHRPLYDWYLDTLRTEHHPQQIEFSRLNLTYTVMSKRKLLQLVTENMVDGWDDPRMLTIAGLRRRGYTPEAIRNFCAIIGISKKDSRIDMGVLENCIREDLNEKAPRALVVLHPLKLIIDNYPDDQEDELTAANHPKNSAMGSRKVPFCKEIYIEQADFMEEPPKKFYRLAPGREVRLRFAYLVTCEYVRKDPVTGELEIHCTYDPASRGGSAPDGRKVKGTIHWVSARHGINAEVRLYDRLFAVENPEADSEVDFKTHLNPDSLTILDNCVLEPSLAGAAPGSRYQFERQGYFYADHKDSSPGKPVFNKIAGLRDSWAKRAK
ncbi:MAG: glutamine--tRNA ligase/YqeY domain fusion protein [Deltaproteobacteria bacterium]|nr:glutamine--tRNA ligase/YqeY domain fusion protein [Deltaproteobacteria bacterium]